MQLEMFEDLDPAKIKLEDLFQAYFDCRIHKRNTASALIFEANYESQLVKLCDEINSGNYHIGQSVAFIVNKPVKREVFAANFRDRIVHHLVINKINHLLEKAFIDDCYSCRVNKGTLFGIHKIRDYMKECSEGYTKQCYILKLDVQAFFMSIDKNILYAQLLKFLRQYYNEPDKVLILELLKKIVYNCPQYNCVIKGKRSNWDGLPHSKSLFYCKKNKGLPIGNLTSQIFANFYMAGLDNFITRECGVKYYGRYVDDFVLIHPDKAFLLEMKGKIDKYLRNKLHLNIHPKKIYLQPFSKGVKFIGAVIKPDREYVSNRTKGNFYEKVHMFNDLLKKENLDMAVWSEKLVSSMNSYLGHMKHYKTYNIRVKVLNMLDNVWKATYYTYNTYQKIILKNKHRAKNINYQKYKQEKIADAKAEYEELNKTVNE